MAMFASLGVAKPGRADLFIEAPTIQATAGTSGSFDVLIFDDPSRGNSFRIAGDALELSLTGPSGVSFTGVTIATTTPYLYLVPGTTQGGGPFSFDTFPNADFLASDAEFGPVGYAEVAPGGLFGIAHVSYSVDLAAVAGDRTLVVGAGTSLSDDAGNLVPFTAVDGILGVQSVPEPSTCVLVALGLAGVSAYRRGRARGRRAPATPAP